jgi:pimeloyl-ACP methyl ester carboxylesterase
MKHLGSTPPFLGVTGEPLRDSIAEVSYRRLGGLDQWVMIRGESVVNPPLIMLHGGPGLSETALFRHFNAALEKHFTVVYWDQRGAGKSFARTIPDATMTVEQFLSDLDELVGAVRVRLGHGKVTIFGHSWGSVLGALYAARHPDKVAAYAGGAQIGDWPAAEAGSYAYAVATAERLGNEKVLRKLRAIGPPPYSAKAVFTERTCVQRLDGQLSPRTLISMARLAVGGPEASLLDVPNTVRGFRWTLDVMWPEVSTLNLLELVPVLRVPVLIFLGRRDHWVPAATTLAYFDALTAPSKQLLWFEQSGHEMFMDEPEKFNRAMIELVRPRAVTGAPAPVVAGGMFEGAARGAEAAADQV